MFRATPHPTPGQHCPGCAGRGFTFHEYTEAHRGCPHCHGKSVAGVFLVRARTYAGDDHEPSWHTHDFAEAVHRARRTARLLGALYPDTEVEAVRAVYVPRPEETAGQGDGAFAVFTAFVVRIVTRAAP